MHPKPRLALVAAAAMAACSAHAATYTWSAGSFVDGVTSPSPLGAADVLNIVSGGTKIFVGNQFTTNGTVNWQADGIFLQSGATVTNAGLWNATSDSGLFYNGGAAVSFLNQGTFRKSAGTGDTTIGGGTGFVNSGTIDAQTGRILFQGGSRFDAGSVFTGAGTVAITGGTNTFAGSYTSGNLQLASGSFDGVSAVAQGTTAWTGGQFTGGWTVAAGGTLRGQTGGSKVLVGTTMNNQGTIAWDTTDSLYIQSGAVLVNNATMEFGQSAGITYNGGAAVAVQNAAGATLRAKTGVTLTVGGGTNLSNNGTLEAQSGARILYQGSTTFANGTAFTGAGANLAVGNNTFSGTYTSGNLELQGGTHTGSGAVSQGTTVWSGGAVAGDWTIASGHGWRAAGGGNKIVLGTVVNQGTLDWNTTDSLYLQSGGTLTNQALLLASETATFSYNGGQATTLSNTAAGTVRVAAGKVLTLGNGLGVVNTGTLDAQAGGAIVLQGGAALNAGSRYTGAGTVYADNTNTFSGLQQSQNLVLRSGSHVGNAAVVGGSIAWSGGSLSGGWTVGAGQALRGATGGNKIVNAGTLTNAGTVTWGTAETLYLQSAGVVQNQSLWVADATTSMLYNGGAATRFENSGTVRATAGNTLTLGNGLGYVSTAGTLDAVGDIVVQGGALFQAGSRFTGAGKVYADNDNAFAGAYDGGGTLVLRSGTHTGQDAVAGGRTTWSGGNLAGTWTVGSGQVLAATAGGNKLLNGGTLVNQGRLEWSTGDNLFLQSGGVLRNAGTVDVTADTAWLYNGGSAPSVINTGRIVKSAGAGTFTIGNTLGFSNQGVIEVASGTIALPASFTNEGTLKGTGAFSVNGTLTNAGHVAPGASPGTLTINGNYAQSAAGSFDVEVTSAGPDDLLLVNGNATLGGALVVQCYIACSYAVGDQIVVLDATGSLSGSFASLTLSGFAQGAFDVVYDTAGARVLLQVTQATLPVPEPATWLMWGAGLAWLARRKLRG